MRFSNLAIWLSSGCQGWSSVCPGLSPSRRSHKTWCLHSYNVSHQNEQLFSTSTLEILDQKSQLSSQHQSMLVLRAFGPLHSCNMPGISNNERDHNNSNIICTYLCLARWKKQAAHGKKEKSPKIIFHIHCCRSVDKSKSESKGIIF